MEPSKLGPFNIVRKLGEGGMGAVFEGEDEQGQHVAIKLLSQAVSGRRGIRERFELEIETLRKLDHPNIVKLFGFGEQDGQLYYTMEMVNGVNLEDKLTAGYRFKWREAAKIGVFLCRALQHAHDRGIVHRDIKPENVMLTNQGRVKLADFGIARIWGVSNVTNPGGLIGTANYMSPEQAAGQPVSPRSDMYSLGMSLYALIVGRPAFVSDSLPHLLKMHIEKKPKSLAAVAPEVPEAFDKLVMRLLTKEVDKRIANPEALARRLEDLLRDEGRQAKEKAKRLHEMGEEGTSKEFASYDDQMKKPQASISAPSSVPKRSKPIQKTDVADDDLNKTIIATGGKQPQAPAHLSQDLPPMSSSHVKDKMAKSLEPYEPDEPFEPAKTARLSEMETEKSIKRDKKIQPPTALAKGQQMPQGLNLDLDEEETAPRMGPRKKASKPAIEAPAGLALDLDESVEIPPQQASGEQPFPGSFADSNNSFYSTKAQADQYEANQRKQREEAEPRRIEISGSLLFVVVGLIVFIGAVYLFTMPPSADSMLAELKPLLGSNDFNRLAAAEADVEKFLNSHVDHPEIGVMEELKEEIDIALFVVNPGRRINWSADDTATAELVTGAIVTSQVDPEKGLAELEAALAMHTDLVDKLEGGKSLDIKKKRIDKTLKLGLAKKKKLAVIVEERRAGQLKHLDVQLQSAELMKTLNPIKARAMLEGMIYLYRDKVWAASRVEIAQQLLASLPVLTPVQPTPALRAPTQVQPATSEQDQLEKQPAEEAGQATSTQVAPDPFAEPVSEPLE